MLNNNLSSPRHVGLILDGNRRWAKQHGYKTLDGHKKGAEVFKDIALHIFDRGVEYLSAFVFSTENWKRTEEEVSYLMKLVVKAVEKYLDEFDKKGIRIKVVGRRDNLSKTVISSIEKTESKTKNNSKGTLVLCFNYGGQQEIVDAVNDIIATKTQKNPISIKDFEHFLYSPDVPPLDLLIRSSGEQRISGFMLWRAAYAEFMFINALWPDVTNKDIDIALEEYSKRQRRFGG